MELVDQSGVGTTDPRGRDAPRQLFDRVVRGGHSSICADVLAARIVRYGDGSAFREDGNMHVGDDEGHLLTDRACVLDASRTARRLRPSATGWADGVAAGIPGPFGERPWLP